MESRQSSHSPDKETEDSLSVWLNVNVTIRKTTAIDMTRYNGFMDRTKMVVG
jgi:hypothetical protein